MKKIGEVADLTGLSLRSLRYYEEVGLVAPERTDGGFRLYSEDDVARILLVRRMKPLEFTLEEMRTFLAAYDNADAGTLAEFEAATEHRLEKLQKRVGYAEEFLRIVRGKDNESSKAHDSK